MKVLFALIAAALLTGGATLSLNAQERPVRDRGDDGPRMSPEERRERWEQMRGRFAEDRRGGEEARSPQEREVPERYLDQLEFRSILSMDGVTQFTLRNPFENNRTLVLTEEEGRNGIEVVEFDAANSALTLRHEDETRTLYLQSSRVAEMTRDPAEEERERRRELWEARRERFQEFRATWEAAAEHSPELREIEGQMRELAGEFRETFGALREAEPGTPEHQALVERGRELREEFRLLGEYSLLHVKQNPAFSEDDAQMLEQMQGMMMRGMAQRQRGGGGAGAGGEGRRGPGR